MSTIMVPAKFYNQLTVVKGWKWITIHCTQGREVTGGAMNTAHWFEKPWDPKKQKWIVASAHIAADNIQFVQCVPLNRIAYHARGINLHSIGLELVGTTAQTREQWLDDYGKRMFAIAAPLIARWSRDYGIQIDDEVTAGGILLGNGGVTTHAQVTAAYKIRGGHTDPGPNFPMDVLLELANRPGII